MFTGVGSHLSGISGNTRGECCLNSFDGRPNLLPGQTEIRINEIWKNEGQLHYPVYQSNYETGELQSTLKMTNNGTYCTKCLSFRFLNECGGICDPQFFLFLYFAVLFTAKCNGIKECESGSDEWNCSCPSGSVPCDCKSINSEEVCVGGNSCYAGSGGCNICCCFT